MQMVSKSYCQTRAREVREQLGIRPPAPVDVEKMATDWGVAVEYVVRASGFHGVDPMSVRAPLRGGFSSDQRGEAIVIDKMAATLNPTANKRFMMPLYPIKVARRDPSRGNAALF